MILVHLGVIEIGMGRGGKGKHGRTQTPEVFADFLDEIPDL